MQVRISSLFLLFVAVLNEQTTSSPTTFSKDSNTSQLSNGTKKSSCKIGGESISIEGGESHAVVGIDSFFYLECFVKGDLPDPVFKSWNNLDGTTMVFQNDVLTPSMSDRVTVQQGSENTMILKVDEVKLSDAGDYKCEVAGLDPALQAYVTLSVDKTPDVYVKLNYEEVIVNNVVEIGTCFADAAKPQPTLSFVDSNGEPVNTYSTVNSEVYGEYGLSNNSLSLMTEFNKEDNNKEYFCKVSYSSQTNMKNYTKSMGKVNVKYPATVSLKYPVEKNSMMIMEEKEAFIATCEYTGNPRPQITWTFKPDSLYRPPNSTEPEMIPEASTTLPTNFLVTEDGTSSKLSTTSLEITEKEFTNNGTFTCIASNGVGPDVDVSFAISVTELPTTTPPPTTPADIGNNGKAVPTMKPEPQSADAAVIGGVVAVAVFVLIVAIILLVRYFMSHKGEYYTNEVKASEDVRESSDIEDGDSHNESDLLTNKRREEFFM